MPNDRVERSDKRTIGFHERYENDAEFKRQVDEGRVRSKERKSLAALQSSLSMVKDKRKLY